MPPLNDGIFILGSRIVHSRSIAVPSDLDPNEILLILPLQSLEEPKPKQQSNFNLIYAMSITTINFIYI